MSTSINTTATGVTVARQAASISTGTYHEMSANRQVRFLVEKVDNGFILRSGRYEADIQKTKICKDIDELRDMFVAVLVDYKMEG